MGMTNMVVPMGMIMICMTVSMTVSMTVIMTAVTVSVMPAKNCQVDQIDCYAGDCKNEHQLAINTLWVDDSKDSFIDQDAGHYPDDKH